MAMVITPRQGGVGEWQMAFAGGSKLAGIRNGEKVVYFHLRPDLFDELLQHSFSSFSLSIF